MANIKSVIKDIRRTKKRTLYNSRLKNRVKDAEKAFEKAVKANDAETAKKYLTKLSKVADKATKKGVMKKGTVSRKKSRLAKKLNTTAANVKANNSNS